MYYCVGHSYAGVFRCPWPLCPRGLSHDKFRFERGTLVERIRFDNIEAVPTYAWLIPGVTTAHAAAQLARRAVVSLNATTSPDDDGHLYHFTSEASARKIFESGDFWMMDYRDFTDKSEIKHGLEVASVTFESLTHHLHDLTQDILAELIRRPLPSGVYVTCFSMVGDSALHWEHYAADSTGVALVVDPAGFDSFLAVDPFTIQLSRVAYTWDKKAEMFDVMARYLDAVVRFDVTRGTLNRDAYVRESSQVLLELLPICKDISFMDEREMRIVYSPFSARSGSGSIAPRSFHNRSYVTMRDVLPVFELPVVDVIAAANFGGDLQSLRAALRRVHPAERV